MIFRTTGEPDVHLDHMIRTGWQQKIGKLPSVPARSSRR